MPPCTACPLDGSRPTPSTLPASCTPPWSAGGREFPVRAPPAPQSGGQPLRPRKVRAGIPKALDAICDDVLSPFATPRAPTPGASRRPPRSTTPWSPSSATRAPPAAAKPIRRPCCPGPSRHDGHPGHGPRPPIAPSQTGPTRPEHRHGRRRHGGREPPAGRHRRLPSRRADAQETAAGGPAFETDWLTAAQGHPAPTAAVRAAARRPLYAPDPVRRPRPAANGDDAQATAAPGNGARGAGSEYWPWDAGQRQRPRGPGEPGPRARGQGPRPVLAAARGRARVRCCSCWRIVAFAFDLGQRRRIRSAQRRSHVQRSEPPDTEEASGAPIKVSGADDYDPQGDPPEEYPEDVAKSSTATRRPSGPPRPMTRTSGQAGSRTASECCSTSVTTRRRRGGDRLRRRADRGGRTSSDEAPSGTPSGEPVAEDTASKRRLTLSLPEDSSGRYLLLWLTSLPDQGGFRGELREISVRS